MKLLVASTVFLGLMTGQAAARCCGDCDGDGKVQINELVRAVNNSLDGCAGQPRFVDNGDGTIADNNTGLMWEKKDDSGGIHDVNNSYTWCGAPCGASDEMGGTITTTFLAALNGGGGFAGHTDWRIPEVGELQTIVDYQEGQPSVDPAFHQSATCDGCWDVTLASCSCTRSNSYWSSTSYAKFRSNAWIVDFFVGHVFGDSKKFSLRVRAVRGGS